MILSMSLLVLISFTGFVVRDIPVYFEWIQSIAYVSFAAAALVKSEFDGIAFMHPNGSSIEGIALLTNDPFLDDELMEATREDIHVLSNESAANDNQIF